MSRRFVGALVVFVLFPSAQVTQAPQVRVDYILSYGANGYKWKVFIGENPPVLDRISCVEYTLDPTFPDPVRKTCKRADKFAISVTGLDAFKILIKIEWRDGEVTRQSYVLGLHQSVGPTSVTLNNSFIEKYKDRVTIDATFTVDKTSKIHPPSLDGDIHIAGRAPEIGLAAVAEIMNAKLERQGAVKRVQSIEGTNSSIPLTGAWRIWSEHGGEDVEAQGGDVQPLPSSGAPHVFQIHPVSKVDGHSITHTFAPTAGFQYKDADTAFTAYERTSCQIVPKGTTTTIITNKVGFNYTEFVIVIRSDEPPHAVQDGTMIFADVQDLQGEDIVKRRRMVFVKDTDAEAAVLRLHTGDTLHVIGIPRIDLALVSWRVSAAADPNRREKFPQVLNWSLPYEMIVVAVLD